MQSSLSAFPVRFRSGKIAIDWYATVSWLWGAFLFVAFVGFSPLSAIEEASASDGAEGDMLRQAAYFLIALLIFLISLRKNGVLALRKMISIAVILPIAWAIVTIAWSASPDVAVRRVALTGLVLFVAFAATNILGPSGILKSTARALILIVAASLVAGLVSPNAIHQSSDALDVNLVGNWKGIFPHKNIAGVGCIVLIVISIFLRRELGRTFSILAVILGSIMLYESMSKTSMIVLLPAIAFGLIGAHVLKYKAPRQMMVIFMPLVAAFGVLLSPYVGWAAEAILADPYAFTGRGRIWSAVLAMAADQPLTGVGFGSIFRTGFESPLFRYASGWIVTVPHAHNGYLELYASVGLVGMCLALISYLAIPLAVVLTNVSIPQAMRACIIAIVAMAAMHNLSESSLMYRDRHMWIMLCVAIAIVRYYSAHPVASQNRADAFQSPQHV